MKIIFFLSQQPDWRCDMISLTEKKWDAGDA